MTLGQTREVVEVTGEVSQINTEDAKLATTVSATQIENLPLNGRNVYDLMQQAPGAVNVNGVDFENGHGTVVNGLREDFNGFLINGVANKGLSGGVNNTPIEDTVQEFQQLQLNMSAQYGNSAGSVNNLVTKSGTNSYHGSVWEYFRNDYARCQRLLPESARRCQSRRCASTSLAAPFGGAIIKDKLFFFGSYQGDRFTTVRYAADPSGRIPGMAAGSDCRAAELGSGAALSEFQAGRCRDDAVDESRLLWRYR